MNVFVLSTGRCGSTTFVRACEHLTNYTAGHETRSRMIGHERLSYPDYHIESDNRLSWFLGPLDERYGDRAYYVHLVRDSELVSKSYSKLTYRGGILDAYYNGIVMRMGRDRKDRPEPDMWHAISRDMCATINSNISLFLKDKSNKIVVRVENARDDFAAFLDLIDAEGDLTSALDEWDIQHNKDMYSPPPRSSWISRMRNRKGSTRFSLRRKD